MAHDEQFVSALIVKATPLMSEFLATQPEERRQRLDGLQSMVDDLLRLVEVALWAVILSWLRERAEAAAGVCRVCSKRCSREHKQVSIRTKRVPVVVDVVRYRCRDCGTSRSPVREWLGLQAGMTTSGLDRAMTSLSAEMSFGGAAKQMLEQHGHEVNRTLVERRTYEVGRDAIKFLQERREARKEEVMTTVGTRSGADQVCVQVDSGGVPVGKLERPRPEEATERTPVRQLPKGHRPKSKREVRVCVAWKLGVVEGKVVDLHVAPYKQPEVSGDRLYSAALEAGMGDNTHVHCTCDMAKWQYLQFEEQFSAQKRRSFCADFFHAAEYIGEAGKVAPLAADGPSWFATQRRRLKAGERDLIEAELRRHQCCNGGCVKNDRDECTAHAAKRYLKNHGRHMDYPRFLAEGLPIGSGEVEGRIRHLVRRRLDVPGDWREDNLPLLLAIISIRQSGWWDEFWEWRDNRDKERFRRRLRGDGLNRFRGLRAHEPRHGTATERTSLDEPELPLTNEFSGT